MLRVRFKAQPRISYRLIFQPLAYAGRYPRGVLSWIRRCGGTVTGGTSGAQQRLRELLTMQGVTGAELARRLGEPPMWVSDRVRGHSTITADDLPRIAEALGIDPCLFFHSDSGKTPLVPGMLPDYIRASAFAREMAASWSNLHPQERSLLEAAVQAAASAAAHAVLATLQELSEQTDKAI